MSSTSLPLSPVESDARAGDALSAGWRWLISRDGWVLVGMFLWAALGIGLAVHQAHRIGGAFTGDQAINPNDWFQYLAWVRQAGGHGLIGDQFQLGAAHHDFLQPMFLVSGLLWRLGVNLPIAYLLWGPVAIVLTWWSFRALARRHLSGGNAQAALVLGLVYVSPVAAAMWFLLAHDHGVISLSGEANPVGEMLGYLPRVLAEALLPVLLLSLEAIIDHDRRRAGVGKYVAIATGAAGLAAWLHPWQGLVALVVIVGIGFWSRKRRHGNALILPALGAALPLAYYWALSHFDALWATGSAQNSIPRPDVLAHLACLLPIVGVALLGAKLSLTRSTRRRLLFLWLGASGLGYMILTVWPPHMLGGVTLPLGILAVEGWTSARGERLRTALLRTRPSTRTARAIAAVMVAICALPGLVAFLQRFHEGQRAGGMAFTAQDNRALAYLERSPISGGVFATPYISSAVPAYTGRATWFGHYVWTPFDGTRYAAATQLFQGRLNPQQTRAVVAAGSARFILIDCRSNTSLDVTAGGTPEQRLVAVLGRQIVSRRDFGCASVLQLRGQS